MFRLQCRVADDRDGVPVGIMSHCSSIAAGRACNGAHRCPIGHVLQSTASAVALQPSLLMLNDGLDVKHSAHSVRQAKLSELCHAALQGADAEQWGGGEAPYPL